MFDSTSVVRVGVTSCEHGVWQLVSAGAGQRSTHLTSVNCLCVRACAVQCLSSYSLIDFLAVHLKSLKAETSLGLHWLPRYGNLDNPDQRIAQDVGSARASACWSKTRPSMDVDDNRCFAACLADRGPLRACKTHNLTSTRRQAEPCFLLLPDAVCQTARDPQTESP